MAILRKILWGITIFTYVVFTVTIIGDVFYVPDFNPSQDWIYTLLSLCCMYTFFSFFISGANIIAWIAIFICDRINHNPFRISDIFLLLLYIGWVPVSWYYFFSALISV